MANKERLKGIEERVLVDKVYYKYLDGTKGYWSKVYTLSEGDYNYLKEQAKRAQELEKESRHYRKVLKNIYELAEYDEYDNTLEQIVSEIKKALDGKKMSDKECEEFVCDYCGTELDETDEYHTTFHTCDKDCYMKMVGLSWGDFI